MTLVFKILLRLLFFFFFFFLTQWICWTLENLIISHKFNNAKDSMFKLFKVNLNFFFYQLQNLILYCNRKNFFSLILFLENYLSEFKKKKFWIIKFEKSIIIISSHCFLLFCLLFCRIIVIIFFYTIHPTIQNYSILANHWITKREFLIKNISKFWTWNQV
jgi:hypothetical protein